MECKYCRKDVAYAVVVQNREGIREAPIVLVCEEHEKIQCREPLLAGWNKVIIPLRQDGWKRYRSAATARIPLVLVKQEDGS